MRERVCGIGKPIEVHPAFDYPDLPGSLQVRSLATDDRAATRSPRGAHPRLSLCARGALRAEESFRALSEIDAERGELFLARAVLLVEGRTEKQSFPFVFRALGHDADREAITILESGGKPNMPLFIRICHAARVPCLPVHDRDAPAGSRPSRGERSLNAEIAALAGAEPPTVLAPDFEAVAGLRGHRHKPAHAWRRFSTIEPSAVPAALREAVERVVALARA